jgi:hypothetical protein
VAGVWRGKKGRAEGGVSASCSLLGVLVSVVLGQVVRASRRQECFAFQLAAALVKPAISGGHDERLAYLRAADPQRAEDSRLAREAVGLETIRQNSGCNWFEATALCEARVLWCWEPNCGFTAQMVQVDGQRDGMG